MSAVAVVHIRPVYGWRDIDLDNPEWLEGICPEEFKNENDPWHKFAFHLFGHLPLYKDCWTRWLWKIRNEERQEAFEKLRRFLWDLFSLPHAEKYSYAGWYLSSILVDPPEIRWGKT